VVSETGAPAASSTGLTSNVHADLIELSRHDTLIIVGGDNIVRNSPLKVLNWLRRESRRGVSVGALGSASLTLAMAGLLTGHKTTTHWEYHASFTEAFPSVELLDTIYSVDGKYFTCAGGTASIDLMLHLIERDYGRELSNVVADKMVYTSPRPVGHSQRLSMQAHSGMRHTKFARATEIMQKNIETPLSPSEVASRVGLSARQLERLFKKHLNTSPKSYYIGLRLQKARDLLFQTNLALSEICFACGFSSQTHFSKSYRLKYDVSPSRDTGRLAS